MANCPVCGVELAANVRRCPGCQTSLVWRNGQPFTVWKSKSAILIWKVIITLMVFAIVVMAAIIIFR